MITMSSNIDKVVGSLIRKLKIIANSDELNRTVASSVAGLMRDRIHVQGKAADDSQIGIYSNSYLRYRSGQFKNSGKVSRGPNKGKTKNAGTFTKGKSAGGKRTSFNRGTDPKVILSLTRQMEADLGVNINEPVKLGGSAYGIGFRNDFNAKKAEWNEKRYGKKIFALDKHERSQVKLIAEQFTRDALSQ